MQKNNTSDIISEKKESKSLPIDHDNAIIIIPKNCEIQMMCTNITDNYKDLQKREEKREELRKRQEERKNRPDPYARKQFTQLKKRVVKAPPINREKVIGNIVKLKRAITSLEKEIQDLTQIDDKTDDKRNKELEEIKHLTELVEKWKAACQEGIIELQKQLSESYPDMTMNRIVDLLKVDPKEIGYDPEAQDFI